MNIYYYKTYKTPLLPILGKFSRSIPIRNFSFPLKQVSFPAKIVQAQIQNNSDSQGHL